MSEIKKHKPEIFVKHVSIAKISVNNNLELKIITKTKKDNELVREEWPNEAFHTGVKIVKINELDKWILRIEGANKDYNRLRKI